MRFHKVIRELINEHLVARIHRAASDDLPPAIASPGKHIEISLERV